jgi:hypothetical protein
MLYWLTRAERFDFGLAMAGFAALARLSVVASSGGDEVSEDGGVALMISNK